MDGRFCANCGTEVGSGAGSSAAPRAASPGAAGLTENMAAALTYALGAITGILFLLWAPYSQNRTIRFHAFQSIFLTVAYWVLSFVLFIVLPWRFAFSLMRLVQIGAFILWLLLMWKAYNNDKLVLPVIGDFAQKQM
jgi:uncharacterized membrane protein